MKKQIRLTFAAAVLAAGLMGGFLASQMTGEKKQEEPDSAVEKEKVCLDYYVWQEEEFYAKEIVKAFNASQVDIQVNLHILDKESYDSEITERIQAGEKVDVFDIRGISTLCDYQSQELLLDLTQRVMSSDIDLTVFGNIVANVLIDDKYYAMPCRSTCWVLAYNKEIFDEMNEPYPEQLTWQEYRKLALRLKHRDEKGRVIWGGLFVNWDPNLIGVQHGNYLYDDDLTETKKSLEFLNTLVNVDKSHISTEQMEEESDYYMVFFESGRVAMMPMGEWFVGMIQNDEKAGLSEVDWDLAPFPVDESMAKGTTLGQYQFIGITQSCENQAEAFQFLQYVIGKEGAKIYSRNGMLSAYTDEEVREIYKNTVGDKNTDVFFQAFRVQEAPVFEKYGQLQSCFKADALRYFAGEATLEETMDVFDGERKAMLQEKMDD